MILLKFFNYINNLSNFPFIFISPHVYAIGNCGEEIYFALLKARREKKKLIILRPYELPWKFRFRITNQELFNIDSDYRCFNKKNIFEDTIGRCLLTFVYAPFRIINLISSKFFKKKIKDIYIYPSIGEAVLWQTNKNLKKFSWERVRSFNWKKELNTYLPVRLRVDRHEKAEKIQKQMGIPLKDWFVCLHVREGGFHKDYENSKARNASIGNYILAIKAITNAGGWVVRMGDSTMTPLPVLERVIDYPHTPFKSDLMDIYLIKSCKFYMGSQSGIMDVALLFQKPVLMPNMYHWFLCYPQKKNDLGLIKHIYSHSRQRFLSVQDIFEEPWDILDLTKLGADYEMTENTPEEIKDLVLEYLNAVNAGKKKYSVLQKEANRRRILQAHQIFKQRMFLTDDLYNKYRIASRIESCVGALSKKYLESNWEKSSLDLNL